MSAASAFALRRQLQAGDGTPTSSTPEPDLGDIPMSPGPAAAPVARSRKGNGGKSKKSVDSATADPVLGMSGTVDALSEATSQAPVAAARCEPCPYDGSPLLTRPAPRKAFRRHRYRSSSSSRHFDSASRTRENFPVGFSRSSCPKARYSSRNVPLSGEADH